MVRSEAVQYFSELLKEKQNGTLILDSDCRILLITQINGNIFGGIELQNYKEADINVELEKIEKKLIHSYETFKYAIKLGSGSEFFKNYETLLETTNKCEALKVFLDYFNQYKQNLLRKENVPDIVFDVSISPFDVRCIYLKFIKEESEVINKLEKLEKDLVDSFNSFN